MSAVSRYYNLVLYSEYSQTSSFSNVLLFSIHSNVSGRTDDLIVHVLLQHAASSFRKEFEAVVGEVIEDVLLEYFEAAYSDSKYDNDS